MEVAKTLQRFLDKVPLRRQAPKLEITEERMFQQFPRLHLLKARELAIAIAAMKEEPQTHLWRTEDGQIYALKHQGKKPRKYVTGTDKDGKPEYGFTFGGVQMVRLTFKKHERRAMRRAARIEERKRFREEVLMERGAVA